MKGYKAFDKDLRCREFQFEIGKTYTFDGKPVPCMQGFHFCKSVADCYSYYPMVEETRVCEVEASGDVETDDEVKYCTNEIKIVREIEKPREASNTSESSSGYCNSGNCNSGNWNSGDRNSGNRNSGDRNSGNWNSGNWNSGVFCKDKNPKIKMFDKDSGWTIENWFASKARYVMSGCPYPYSTFVYASDMTDEEKARHPEHETIGGYVKVITVTDEDKQKWWDGLPEDDKKAVFDLPNFDPDTFKECTGIRAERRTDD